MENELSNRNKWGFSTGCTFRDLTYVLVSLFFLTFIQYTAGLSALQFSVLSGIIIACRIWDAFNDPMMSTIISNTHSKQGRYKPYILWGSVASAAFLVMMFLSPGLKGWAYVAYLGVAYLFFGMAFTVNDVSYWSLLPHLARSKNVRDKLTGLVAIFASLGSFITGGLIPFLQTGNMVQVYRIYSIICAVLLISSQVMVYFVVQDKDNSELVEKPITIKEMFKIIFRNKQLVTMVFVVLIYTIASGLVTTLGTNFFYVKLGYNGTFITIVTVVFAIGSLASQALYAKIAEKFTRAQIVKVCTWILVISYLVLFGFCLIDPKWVGGTWPYVGIFSFLALICFAGQGVIYLAILVMLSNTIEFDEWKNGKRNESIIFTVRSFMVKLAAAFESAILYLCLMITGVYVLTQTISGWETLAGQVAEGTTTLEEFNTAISGHVTNPESYATTSEALTAAATNLLQGANFWQVFGLACGLALFPAILYLVQYIIIKKNYIIDEPFYEKLLADIDAGNIPNPNFKENLSMEEKLAYHEESYNKDSKTE